MALYKTAEQFTSITFLMCVKYKPITTFLVQKSIIVSKALVDRNKNSTQQNESIVLLSTTFERLDLVFSFFLSMVVLID